MVKRILRDERGQSAIVMAMIVIAILAIFALVVDIGNAYAERRRAQNAADAAALAGATQLAERVTTNRAVINSIKEFAMRNGMPEDGVTRMAYIDVSGNILAEIPDTTEQPLDEYVGVYVEVYKEFATYFARVLRWDTLPAAADSKAYVCFGLKSSGGLFPIALSKDAFAQDPDGLPDFGKTYTIWDSKPEAPGNFGWVNWGDRGTVEPAFYPGQPPKQNTSEQNLVNNMHDTERSGAWNTEEWLDGSTGNMRSNKVREELDLRISGQLPRVVTIPIYDQVDGVGANAKYRISGFAHLRISSYGFVEETDADGHTKQVWSIQGRFEPWAAATMAAGGPRYGGRSACYLTNPRATKDIVSGDIKVRVPTLKDYSETTTEYPMDIVLVMDKSGSMDDPFATGGKKITAAKNALNGFLDRTAPTKLCKKADGSACAVCADASDDLGSPCTPDNCPDMCQWLVDTEGVGDRVGFVYYPVTENGARFKAACSGTWRNTYYFGSVRNELTDDKDALKSQISGMSPSGWTPIAGAMHDAVNVVQNDWRGDSLKFIILASDGMANVPLSGQPTEVNDAYYGPLWPYPACNQASADDAIAEAIRATNKHDLPLEEAGAEAVVFTIAIGKEGNFNTTLLEAMASQNPNWKPGAKDRFFYDAGSADELNQAYEDIQREIETIKEGCSISYYNALADGATVKLKQGGVTRQTVDADAAGSFTFGNVDPGTYTVEVEYDVDGVNYDVYTDRLGGAPLSPEEWTERYTFTVPEDSVQQTYGPVNFYMETSQVPSCAD
jgi:hypothetical protein